MFFVCRPREMKLEARLPLPPTVSSFALVFSLVFFSHENCIHFNLFKNLSIEIEMSRGR